MAATSIEWTEKTWNPLAGCSIASPGCHHCYAATMAHRLAAMGQEKYVGTTEKKNGHVHWTGKITLDEESLGIPLRVRKPTMWFVNSMSDIFHEKVPFDFVDKVFAVMGMCKRHTFQVLTKRADRMRRYFEERSWNDVIVGILQEFDSLPLKAPAPEWMSWFQTQYRVTEQESARGTEWPGRLPLAWPLPNVWLGCSVEDQARADERIPFLLQTPAAIRFLSVEPLLGPVDLGKWFEDCRRAPAGSGMEGIRTGFKNISPDLGYHAWPPCLDWVIVGGESGHGARPCALEWIRSLVRQCKEAKTACFVKQLGSNPYQFDPKYGTRDICGDMLVSAVHQFNRKGGSIEEFPADLRVREFPKITEAVTT